MNIKVLTSFFKEIKSGTSKKLLLLVVTFNLSLVFGGFTLKAQVNDPNDQVFTIVQQQPKFPGDMNRYIANNIQYPEKEKNSNITGTVFITFVVEKDGHLTGIRILRGVPGGPGLDAEAIRVIGAMPKWAPGQQNGQPVRVQYSIPILFKLK